jgi:hypothetical protein
MSRARNRRRSEWSPETSEAESDASADNYGSYEPSRHQANPEIKARGFRSKQGSDAKGRRPKKDQKIEIIS